MKRTLIEELGSHVEKTVSLCGWVSVRRDQGKLIFFDFRDRTSVVQGVVLPDSSAMDVAKDVRNEYIVRVEGLVQKRPEKNIQIDKKNGDIELKISAIEILSVAHEIPFERDADVNLDTLFDFRPFTLRNQRSRDIFAVQATIVAHYRSALITRGFTDFQAPALVGEDAEGGAQVFRVHYFEDTTANLATSPQLYKQIMVGAFERVMTIAKIFRAEKSATTRHLAELTQMDFEMGFIKDEFEVMKTLEEVIRETTEAVISTHSDVFEKWNIPKPMLGTTFPVLTLAEALKITGSESASDMDPESERKVCEWALKEHNCDFVFITKFPVQARAFYTMSDGANSRGFDLLFRGLEINSGAQRIHSYDELIARIIERGMNPDKFAFYLQAFKYGMPPHGGCSTGLERFTGRMLMLDNVKEASAFPRDMTRIDMRLSQ